MTRGQCAVVSATVRGVDVVPVMVEVAVSSGLPGMAIVGMPDAAVQEARERVRSAIRSAGFSMPGEKIVVNLAPADVRKTGSGFDLPIAVGILVASQQVDPAWARETLYVGELSLGGRVRPVSGSLACAVCARTLQCDFVCAREGDPIPLADVRTYAIDCLDQLGAEGGAAVVLAAHSRGSRASTVVVSEDFCDVRGHEMAKRAFQIAATGAHGMLMMGPPGSGKTMLASRIPTILPPLTDDEMLETAVIHSVAGEPIDAIVAGCRPFRHPHHSATMAGLIGGGSPIRPGEISLAHRGVLFLDEIPEFKVSALQSLRQPLEKGTVTVTRAEGNVVFPANFMLVAAANPCPCGYFGDAEHDCRCTVPQIRTYQNRIGGPLMDRIDLHLDVRRVAPAAVLDGQVGASSHDLREGVLRGRAFRGWRESHLVGKKGAVLGYERSDLGDEAKSFLVSIAELYAMSGRGIARTVTVARTIADMEESENIESAHIAEAVGYRVRSGAGEE